MLRRLRWQRVSSDVRDCVLESPWFLSVWWRGVRWSPLKWPSGELRAIVSRAGLRSDRHRQFWDDIKFCLCEACWMHLIYIQLGFIVVVYPCCCCWYSRAAVRRLHWAALSSQRECVWQLTRFGGRKWRSGLNRISHPDWVKLSVELICAPNQNTKFFLSLQKNRTKRVLRCFTVLLSSPTIITNGVSAYYIVQILLYS